MENERIGWIFWGGLLAFALGAASVSLQGRRTEMAYRLVHLSARREWLAREVDLLRFQSARRASPGTVLEEGRRLGLGFHARHETDDGRAAR